MSKQATITAYRDRSYGMVKAGLKTLARRPDPKTPRCACGRYMTLEVERKRGTCCECKDKK